MNSLKKLICLLISLQIASSKVGGCVSSANASFCGAAATNGACNTTTGSCVCIATQVGSDCTGLKTTAEPTGYAAWTAAITQSSAALTANYVTAPFATTFTVTSVGQGTQAKLSQITANVKALMALPASPVCLAFFTAATAATPTAPFSVVFTVPSGSDLLLGQSVGVVLQATAVMPQVAAVTSAQLTQQVADAIAAIRAVQTVRAYLAADAVIVGSGGLTATKVLYVAQTQQAVYTSLGMSSQYKMSADNTADISTANALTTVLLPKAAITAAQVLTNVISFYEELNPLLAFDSQSNAVSLFQVWNTPALGYNLGATDAGGSKNGNDLVLTKSTLVANTTVTFTFASTANGNTCKYYDESTKTATAGTITVATPIVCKHTQPTLTTFLTTVSKGLQVMLMNLTQIILVALVAILL